MSFLGKRTGRTGKTIITEVMGDAVAAPTPPTLSDIVNGDFVGTVSAVALTYHGYKRTGSIVWALIYGFAGRKFPMEAVPIALSQGFGEKKACP